MLTRASSRACVCVCVCPPTSFGCERSFYSGFFDEKDYPKSNFRKIMHIHVTHAIVDRYPKVKFVWAHVGLSQELATLHPAVHARILEVFFERFSTNLWLDTSWDVLAKQNFVRGYGASNPPAAPSEPRDGPRLRPRLRPRL